MSGKCPVPILASTLTVLRLSLIFLSVPEKQELGSSVAIKIIKKEILCLVYRILIPYNLTHFVVFFSFNLNSRAVCFVDFVAVVLEISFL